MAKRSQLYQSRRMAGAHPSLFISLTLAASPVLLLGCSGSSTTAASQPKPSQRTSPATSMVDLPVTGTSVQIDDPELARYLKARQYREAEILLSRAIDEDGTNYNLTLSLLEIHLVRSQQFISSGNLQRAGDSLEFAKIQLVTLQGRAVDASSTRFDPNIVVQAEYSVERNLRSLQAQVNNRCWPVIKQAWGLAIDAKGLGVRPADETKVVSALSRLGEIQDLLPWASRDLIRDYRYCFNWTLGLVDTSKRPALLSSAGFDVSWQP